MDLAICDFILTTSQAAELERVRNNQRRSRARRKEYITELEEKIRKHEARVIQVSQDETIQSLTWENGVLKNLLHSMGLGDDFITSYTKASSTAREIAQKATRPEHGFSLDREGCCGPDGCHSSSRNMLVSALSVLAREFC